MTQENRKINADGSATENQVKWAAEQLIFENGIVSADQTKENRLSTIRQNLDFNPNDSDWLSALEAARYLRILRKDGSPCVGRIRNLVSANRIPFYKPFGRLLFRKSELKRFIESSRNGGFKCR